jgi:dihydropteroate synthase
MGVLNVTPDSFSDGGRYLDADRAIAHGLALRDAGADLVDVGGESTRPGATPVPADEEIGRVLPVVSALTEAGVVVSIDTMRAECAAVAVRAGASVVNDVSGGLADPGMYATVAELGIPYVAMHWRGPSATMSSLAQYDDVVVDVAGELAARVAAALAAGVGRDRIVIDPGLGFAKDADHNWALLRTLGTLMDLGLPVLVGASRKRFLGSLLADDAGVPRPLDDRDAATDAISALAAAAGVWAVRVHDVRGSRDAVRVAAAWARGSERD